MKKPLYPWQEDCLEKWFANNGRGIVQAITGSGKTLLALTAAERLEKMLPQELLVKIVVPTGALMRQWHHALKEYFTDTGKAESAAFEREIGLRGAGFKAHTGCRYMIYVINSARYELAKQILTDLKSGAAVLLIADECHRYESEQNRLIFEFLPYITPYKERFFSLGLSATLPSGQSENYLASVLGRRIYNYGMKQAASMNTICRYDIYHIGLSFLPDEEEAYQEITDRMNYLYRNLLRRYPILRDMAVKERYNFLKTLTGDKNRRTANTASMYIKLSFRRKSLVCLASARISCVCELLTRLPPAEKIIIFSERICQAEELYQLLQVRYPGKVGRYHSRMGETANRHTLNCFRDENIRILIACKAIDEGLDVPDASIGIILSGTSVQRQRIQRLGRILRKAEGKACASLYYLHLTETTEDACFLPDTGESRIFDLKYSPDLRDFFNPPYDSASEALLADLRRAGAGSSVIAEAQRCLRLGAVRSDWLSGRDDLDAKIRAAKYISDKNYWVCMKKMGFRR